jgi:RNA-binding protein
LSPSSSKYPIAYVDLRVFSHATEDDQKVQTAVKNILPEGLAAELEFTKTGLTGHHNNPIVLLEAKLTDKALLPSVLEKIAAGLSSLDKEQLCTALAQHVDKHNLYLRFDKQDANLGKVKLSAVDPIHFKIHFKNRAPDEIQQICGQVGLLS